MVEICSNMRLLAYSTVDNLRASSQIQTVSGNGYGLGLWLGLGLGVRVKVSRFSSCSYPTVRKRVSMPTILWIVS